MGSKNSYHYHDAGHKHDDTTLYKDEESLQNNDQHPHKITCVRVWWSKYILAIETFYDDISVGKRQGNHYTEEDIQITDLELDLDEHIEKITGNSSNQIDKLMLHTTKGRAMSFGYSTEGTHFTVHEHGHVVKAFTLGFGANLHYVGAHFGKAYHPPSKSSEVGNVHPNTELFDDFNKNLLDARDITLKELRVLHDEKTVYGVEGIYDCDGQEISPGVHVGTDLHHGVLNHSIVLDEGKYIREIYGRSGDFVDQLSITLSDGTNYNFGSPTAGLPFSNILPGGSKAVAFGGGLGGNLHKFYCYYQNI